jgi:hypothetical protein
MTLKPRRGEIWITPCVSAGGTRHLPAFCAGYCLCQAVNPCAARVQDGLSCIVRRTNIAIGKCIHHTSLSVGHASPTGKKTFGRLCSIDMNALAGDNNE